jgi:hypothetical protein
MQTILESQCFISGFCARKHAVCQILFFASILLFSSWTRAQVAKPIERPEYIFDPLFPVQNREVFIDWMDFNVEAIQLVFGELPVDQFVIRLKAAGYSSTKPVLWGQVDRSSPPKLDLIVSPSASFDELKEDWTLYHELSHLLIPYDGYSARWFSEGLASYYQNVVRARAGVLNEREMWQKFYNGFERGRKQDALAHQSLWKVSREMYKNHYFMRVYWSGALYWLKVDLSLRERAALNPKLRVKSLDDALLQLKKCCQHQSLSARELIAQLDEIAHTKVFSSEARLMSDSKSIPNYMQLFNDWGITASNDKISIANDHQRAQIRRLIADPNAG